VADQPDLQQLTEGSDDEIAEKIRAAGTEQVLDRVFDGMQERFQPDRASGVDAQLQWLVSDDGQEHAYVTTVKEGACTVERGRVDSPRVTFATDLASFGKLMAGRAAGPQLYMTGKLKVQGDMMLAQRATSFFRPAGS
jgi:putative sterol carrier protein